MPAGVRPDSTERARGRSAVGASLLLLLASAAWLPLGRGEIPPPREAIAWRIDPNRASRAELMLIPGIGPALAENIARYRASLPGGRVFSNATDLERVHRIGRATVERMRPFLVFSDPSANPP